MSFFTSKPTAKRPKTWDTFGIDVVTEQPKPKQPNPDEEKTSPEGGGWQDGMLS